MQELKILFLLLAGHFIADIVFQSEKTSLSKNRHFTSPTYRPEIHGPKKQVWFYELLGHSFSHGLATYLATGLIVFGLIETVVHFVIDYLKGEGFYSVHVDQALHISCKLIYFCIIIGVIL